MKVVTIMIRDFKSHTGTSNLLLTVAFMTYFFIYLFVTVVFIIFENMILLYVTILKMPIICYTIFFS